MIPQLVVLYMPLLMYVGSIVAFGALAYSAWQNEHRRGEIELLLLIALGASWAIINTASLTISNPKLAISIRAIMQYSDPIVPMLWWGFYFRYTGKYDTYYWPSFGVFGFLFLVYGAFLVSNPVHHLLFKDFVVHTDPFLYATVDRGPVDAIFSVLLNGAIIVGILALVKSYLSSRTGRRQQIATICGGAVAAFGVHFLSYLSIFPSFLHYKTISIVVLSFATYIALYRYDELDVDPVARSQILNAISTRVLVTDHNGQIVDFNDGGKSLLDADDPIGVDLEAELPHVAGAPDTLEGPTSEEIEMDLGGESRYFDLLISPITADGDRLGTLYSFRDITAEKHHAEELERQNDRLEQFASAVSHDLRNPLNVAESYLDFAEETGDAEDFETIYDAHDRMNDILDDVLKLAEDGQTIDNLSPVDIGALASDSWRHVDTESMTLSTSGIAGYTVVGDESRLRRVFENLFRNAREHGDASRIEVGTLDDVSGFYVADDGAGIPDSQKDDVLTHGFTTSDAGTGFGLSITASIADAHGWDVNVDDSETGGARFEFIIEGSAADDFNRDALPDGVSLAESDEPSDSIATSAEVTIK